MSRILGIALFISIAHIVFAQTSVGINVQDNPNEFAVLELVSPSNNQGLLIPRLTTQQRLNSAFAGRLGATENGLLLFDSDLKKMFYWQDSLWVKVRAGEFPQLAQVLNENNSANFIRIIELASPVDAYDAANKFYVDSIFSTVTLDLSDLITRITSIESSITALSDSISKYSNYFVQIFDSLTVFGTELSVIKDSISVFSSKIDTLEYRVQRFDTVIKEIMLSGLSQVLEYSNDAGNIKIVNLGTPEFGADAATKQYVDDSVMVLRSSIEANNVFINNLDTRVTDNSTAITQLDQRVTNNEDSIIHLDARVTKNEENISQNITYLDSILNKGGTLPLQTGNAGRYLLTDGTNAGWNALAAVAESGNMSDLTNDAGYVTASSLTNNAIPRWEGELRDGAIWDDGNAHVLIGSTVDSVDPAYNLEVAGVFKTSKIYHSSDARYKEQIQPIDSALSKLLQLEGVYYRWKTDEFANMNFPEGVQIGLIAQEIEKVFPELVMTDESGFKSVEYANVVAILIEAFKQQQTIIANQSSRIEMLENNAKTTDARLENIEMLLQIISSPASVSGEEKGMSE